jgi:hypothetical protein
VSPGLRRACGGLVVLLVVLLVVWLRNRAGFFGGRVIVRRDRCVGISALTCGKSLGLRRKEHLCWPR